MSQDRKKVLFLICELYWGGAQKSLLKVISEVCTRHDCWLAVYEVHESFNKAIPVPLIKIDEATGISRRGYRFYHKLSRLYRRVNFVKRFKKQNKIDVCISFMEGADILNVLSNTKHCKTVTSIRGSIKAMLRPGGLVSRFYLKKVLPFIYHKADVIVPVSTVLKTEMEELFGIPGSKVQAIQNFYDLSLYPPLAAAPVEKQWESLFAHHEIIISVGRLNLQKNFAGLIRLFTLFKKQSGRDTRLVIIGTGEDLEMLCTECRANELSYYSFADGAEIRQSDVYFMGYRDNPHQYVARADVFVLTSLGEGFPNTLAEALILGVPCIAADCPTGPYEIIRPDIIKEEADRPGILLPVPVTPEAYALWAGKLQQLLEDPAWAARLKHNAIERMKDFSKEKIIGKWFQVIEA